MTAVVAAECTGMWRRTLLIDADGARDDGGDVRWLQGPTAYVDSRGFAGALRQADDVFEWRRDVDLGPPSQFPDAGRMHWDGITLVETGIHERYVEHWHREEGPDMPCGALFLKRPDGDCALLVRSGEMFGWADPEEAFIGAVGGQRWKAIEIGETTLQSDGVCWAIEQREGNAIS